MIKSKNIDKFDYDSFISDEKTVDAIVRNFEIIGEAAKNIPDNIKDKHQEIDWKGLIGFRNRIVHEYFGMNLQIIWYILKNELPSLKLKMSIILHENI